MIDFNLPPHVYDYYYRGAKIMGIAPHAVALNIVEIAVTGDSAVALNITEAAVTGDSQMLLHIRTDDDFTN